VGLGHRRLSIIDLAGGAQPMFDRTGRYAIVFNGEIYNYRELRPELAAAGFPCSTDSDTETLLLAYAAWGEGCLARLNGMFAFAIYDRETHELFVARDRLGKKPLYYYADRERVLIASELKAIIADPMVPRVIDATSVADYFALSYVPAPKSIYRNIAKLPAGHALRCKNGQLSTFQYWDLDFRDPDESTSLEAHAEKLRELIADAVRLRMRSDVPLGAFLSGGLDSSIVVASMARASDQPVITQAVGFQEAAFDERRYAKEIAERFHTRHHVQVLSSEAGGIAEQLSYFYDEPFGDSSAAPTYFLCQKTRELVTVSLSGDGGDETFAGYDHYPEGRWAQNIHGRLPKLAWQLAAWPLRQLFQVSRYQRPLYEKNRLLYRAAGGGDRTAYANLLPQPWWYSELLAGDTLRGLGDYDPYDTMGELYARSGTDDPLARMLYADTKSLLCDDILVKVDRASMAHALEVRCPLLDYRVIEYAARIPSRHKLDGKVSKKVLRKAVEPDIPPSFFEREKQGFAVPLRNWLRGEMKVATEQRLFGSGRSRLLGETKLKRLWFEHQLGLVDHGARLWQALMFELWYARGLGGQQVELAATPTMRTGAPARFVTPPAASGRDRAGA
jgi:asparagine synthase (glutamine-hydrolysing)